MPFRMITEDPSYEVDVDDTEFLEDEDMGGILDLTKYPFTQEEMDPFATINS